MEPMVEVKNLKKYFWRRAFFPYRKEPVKAVDGVTFSVEKGMTFGLVGESGCGKSTIARLIAGILTPDSGSVFLRGERDIVFQDPSSSLNPRMTASEIVGESLLVRGMRRGEIEQKVGEALRSVRLDGRNCAGKYPHQFSAGERQRIAIARALVRRPETLVLDEPVSSLDVSIQAGILNLLRDLQDELSLTYIFISHDLRVVEFMSDVVGVMKEGRIVEMARSDEIYSNPEDEYTRRLLASIPKIEL